MAAGSKHRLLLESLEAKNLLSATTMESEPNDEKSSANFADFSSGDVTLEGTSTSDRDKDFFVVTVPASGTVDVSVSSGNGELPQVEVEDSTGVERLETEPNDGVNGGSFAALSGEQLYIRVRAKDDFPANYSVSLSSTADATPVDPPTGGDDDGTPDQGSGDAPGTPGSDDSGAGSSDPGTDSVHESENNDEKSNADAFTLNSNGRSVLTGQSANHDDKDFFVFTPPVSGLLSVNVGSSNHNFAQLEIENRFGVSIFETQPNDGVNQGSVRVNAGERLFVRLRSKNDAPSDYVANLHLTDGTGPDPGPVTPPPSTPPVPTGAVSESETNDRMVQANRFQLDAGGGAVLTGVSQNQDDKDYFVFVAPASGLVSLTVDSGNGNFAQAQVENQLGVELFDTEPNDGINNGSFNVQAGQEVFVRMRSKTEAPADYEVDLVFAEGASRQIADANGDGRIGFGDLLRLSQFFGRTDGDIDHGDFNGDSVVNLTDFLILARELAAQATS